MELMVSIVVALVVMAGALRVFVGMRESFRLEDALSRMQENSRYAAEAVAFDARQAGFSGCVGTTFTNLVAVNNLLDPAGANYEPAFYDVTRPLTGFEYTGTDVGDTYTSTGTDPAGVSRGNWSDDAGTQLPERLQNLVVPGTDVLIVKRAGPRQDVTSTDVVDQDGDTITLSAPSGLPANNPIMLVADCGGGDLFQNVSTGATTLSRGSGGTPGNRSGGQWSHSYPPGAEVYLYSVAVYYVGLGAGNEPALFQLSFPTGGVGSNQELVEGVENFQVLYGEDSGDDGVAENYVTADNVTNWERVVSVKMALLMRTPQDSRADLDADTYQLLGTTIDPVDERRVRRALTWTTAVRNRTRLAGAP
ncbi:MAG: PilW family protein [Immundisolibacter sp.]|nr:PilW family protein [Immundisolibacter sp.]